MAARKARSLIPLMVRLPADLHRTLAREAEKSGRSLNTEIIERLRRPFTQEDETRKFQSLAQQTATSTVEQAWDKWLTGWTERGWPPPFGPSTRTVLPENKKS
jgi:Arc-like DNA binding domain